MAAKKLDYNSIAFKNKDVDKFKTAFREKEPKTKTETNKNIFGRTTTYTQTGRDNDNTFTEKVTDRKGRVRKESEGTYKENSRGDVLKDNETRKKYDKAGNVKREDIYNYSSPGTKNEAYEENWEVKKKGKTVRKKEGVYREEKDKTIDMGVKTNRKGQTKMYDRSTTNFNDMSSKKRKNG